MSLSFAKPRTWIIALACVAASSGQMAADPPNEQAGTPDAEAQAPPPQRGEKTTPKGYRLNLEERCVDVDARVCLHEGLLELIACTKGTKEHESIVAIEAQPKMLHLALLLLGVNAGHPPGQRPLDDAGKRWIDVPATGDPVEVSLVYPGEDGKIVERPIKEFLRNKEGAGFPTSTFLFAGSRLIAGRNGENGPRTYLCDQTGNVISIASFGDELLCLRGRHSHANHALTWSVSPGDLPPVDAKVILRLRPLKKPAPSPEDPTQPAPPNGDR